VLNVSSSITRVDLDVLIANQDWFAVSAADVSEITDMTNLFENAVGMQNIIIPCASMRKP